MPTLFDPLEVGDLTLPNRIIMAPLTRCRAGPGRVPNALMSEYYAQRASAGLIISEATSVSPMGVGYPDTPGIWSREQVEGWKLVTRAVHDAAAGSCSSSGTWGGSRTRLILDGELPVAPSAIAARGPRRACCGPRGRFVTPAALETERDPRRSSRLSRRRRERPDGRLRRRRDPRRQRLSARPVPAGQHEPSDR